jgi:hypothetical protein
MRETNEIKPLMTCRKRRDGDQKREASLPVISLAETCLLASRSPALRWHDSHTGPYKKLGNQLADVKGAVQIGEPYKNLSTEAASWDGVVSSSDEAFVIKGERRDYIFWQLARDNQVYLGGSK